MKFLTFFAGWHQRTRKASNDDGVLVHNIAGIVLGVEAGEEAKMIEAHVRQWKTWTEEAESSGTAAMRLNGNPERDGRVLVLVGITV